MYQSLDGRFYKMAKIEFGIKTEYNDNGKEAFKYNDNGKTCYISFVRNNCNDQCDHKLPSSNAN